MNDGVGLGSVETGMARQVTRRQRRRRTAGRIPGEIGGERRRRRRRGICKQTISDGGARWAGCVGADRRGGPTSISGHEFDFHTGDDRTPASAKASHGGSKRTTGVGMRAQSSGGSKECARCGRTRQGSTRRRGDVVEHGWAR